MASTHQFSRSVMSDSLQPWTTARQVSLSSSTPGVYSNSCSLSWWCHSTISSSVVPFSSCLQSFPTSGSFQMSQFFASGGQTIGISDSASVLPMNIQDWFPLGNGVAKSWTRLSNFTHPLTQLSLWSSSHIYTWLLEKPQLWLYRSLSVKWCLCYLMWILLSSLSLFLPCLSNGHNNPPTKFVHCEN